MSFLMFADENIKYVKLIMRSKRKSLYLFCKQSGLNMTLRLSTSLRVDCNVFNFPLQSYE